MSSHKFQSFCRALPTRDLLNIVDFYAQRREANPARYRVAMQTAAERGIY